MIIKPREKSLTLQQYEAILNRIDQANPKKSLIESDYRKYEAGFRGEMSSDYPLSFLDEKKYYIFHELRLSDGKHVFQIDTFLLSEKFCVIGEIKNYSGTLIFDLPMNQLIRTFNGNEEALPNPITQVKRHVRQFQTWLKINKLPEIPIEPLAIISNDKAVIKVNAPNYEFYQIVSKNMDLPAKIAKLEANYKNSILSPRELKKLSRKLLVKQVPEEKNILQKYRLAEQEIIKGTQCPVCHHLSMDRIHSKWICRNCGQTSKDAHIESLRQYALIYNKTSITNREAKEFLKVESRHVMKRLLNGMNLRRERVGKKLVYYFDLQDLDKNRKKKNSIEETRPILG